MEFLAGSVVILPLGARGLLVLVKEKTLQPGLKIIQIETFYGTKIKAS
jgi:hypothetical protein